jgi:hypothetical protein
VKTGRSTLAALAGLLALGASRAAEAQTFGYDDRGPYESRQDFALEFRVGPWTPRIDQPDRGLTPYRDIFGDALRFVGAAEFDWQIVRIGPVMSLGVGAGVGYTNASADAPLASATLSPDPSTWGMRSATNTTLHVIPTTLLAVARFDGLARRYRFLPIAPYVKTGLAYSFWWVMNGSQVARARNGQDAVGGSLGFHVAGGVAVMLDAFEPRLARQWDSTSGVNHSYVFVEGYLTELSGFGRQQLDVGTLSWAAGLSFEF